MFLTLSNSFSSLIAINVISILLLIILISSYNLENNKILAQNPDEEMANMLESLGINPDFYSGGSVELQSPNNVPQNPDEGMANMLEGLGVPSDPSFYGGSNGGLQQSTNDVLISPQQIQDNQQQSQQSLGPIKNAKHKYDVFEWWAYTDEWTGEGWKEEYLGTKFCGDDFPDSACDTSCPKHYSCFAKNSQEYFPEYSESPEPDCTPKRTSTSSQIPNLGTDTILCQTPPKCSPPPAGTPVTPMKISNEGIKFLEKLEGKSASLMNFCSPIVTKSCRMDSNPYGFYNDIAGFCTIGIGHLVGRLDCASIDKLPVWNPIKKHKDDVSWIKNKNDAYLLKGQDLPKYEKIINNNAKIQLTQEQFDALVIFAFNSPYGALSVLDLANKGTCDPTTIKSQFGKYINTKDKTGKLVPVQGLIDRRAQEANSIHLWNILNE